MTFSNLTFVYVFVRATKRRYKMKYNNELRINKTLYRNVFYPQKYKQGIDLWLVILKVKYTICLISYED